MAIEERRRLALHRAASESWGEENADTLMESIVPAGHELATRADVQGILTALTSMESRWDERIDALDQRWDERFTVLDQRWDERFTALEQRWDERFTALEQRWDERLDHQDDRGSLQDQRIEQLDRRWQAEMHGLRHELLGAFHQAIGEAVTKQTRTLVLSQLGAIVVIAGMAFGLR